MPSVFGFGIDTKVPLRFLRDGGAESDLEIREDGEDPTRPESGLIGEWPLHGTALPATASLYAIPGGFEYWTTDAGRFRIDLVHQWIDVPRMQDEILREQRLHGMPMLLQFAHRRDFSLHAAAVEVEGRAAVLAAPSKFGKTTLAFAFHRHGYRLLSEDLACIRPTTMELFPGPAVVRLRPDVYEGIPPEGTEEVAVRPDRVFLRLDAARRGGSGPVPLGGIFFLREGEKVEIASSTGADVVPDLWHLGYRMPTSEGRAASFSQLTGLASRVPIWNLRRPKRLDALDETVDRIVEVLLRS